MTDEYGQLLFHNSNTSLITLNPPNLLTKLWGWTNNLWTAKNVTIPLSTSYLRLKDDDTNQWVDLSLIISDNDPKEDTPLLAISQGVVVKKDLAVGGYLSANQGLIALGSGVLNSFDPPGIWLTHSEMSPLDSIEPRASAPTTNLETGQCYINSGNTHLYQYNGSTWDDKGLSSNYNYHFDTCYIRRSTYDTNIPFTTPNVPIDEAELGNLACHDIQAVNLTAHGTVGFGTAGYLLSTGNGNAYFCQNTYLSDAWRYINTDVASIVRLSAGALTFINASSGAKDSVCSWTERMRVTAGGVLQVDSIQKLDGSAFPFWNGGTVSNDIQINKVQPCLKLFYGGVCEWVIGQYVSGNPTLYFNPWGGASTAMTLGTAGNLTLASSLTATNITLTNYYGGITGTGIEVFLQPRTNDGMVTIYNHATNRAPLRFWEANQCMTLDNNNISLNASGNLGITGSITLASGCVLSNDTNDTLRIASGAHSGQGSSVTIGAQNSGFIHFMSNGGLPFYFNEQLQVQGWISLYRQGVGAVGSFMDWTSGGWQGTTPSNGIATNGDFYVNGNQVLAGGLQFNQGGTSAYIIWSNAYVLTIGATGGPFYYGTGHNYTGYFGALDCGAVFTQYVNPIGSATTVTINAFSTAGDQPIGGSNYAPGVWFNSWGNTNNHGGCIGVGLGTSNQIILNSGSGGVWFNYNGSNFAKVAGDGAWTLNSNCGVASNGSFSTYSSYSSGYLSHSGGNVQIYATSGGTITTSSSSQRYKQDIETLTGCSWLYNLRPVTFDWKDPERAKAEGRQIGLIAEEVYAQNPQLAWLNLEGQVEGVHYDKLCVPIIAELQRLRAEVNELKTKLAA